MQVRWPLVLSAVAAAALVLWLSGPTGTAPALKDDKARTVIDVDGMAGTGASSSGGWERFVGRDGQEVKAALQQELGPSYKVLTLPEGSMVTMDYNEQRIRIFVDEQGKVARTPRPG